MHTRPQSRWIPLPCMPRQPSGRLPRAVALLGASAAALLMAGCESAVPLTAPAPVVNLQVGKPGVYTPPAARNTYSPPPAAASAPPAVQAQPLQPASGIAVQPLAPESAPAAAPLAPAASAAQPAAAPAMPPAATSAAAPRAATPPAAQAPAASAPTPQQQAGPLPANAVRYVCNDGTSFIATFGDISVTLTTAVGVLRLEQTVAADGARYKNGDLQVWFKGREATVNNLAGAGSTTLCVEQR